MTRFARAKGSKSSNERAPEDSTPWEVMKDQLLQAKKDSEESKKRQKAEQQRIENYDNFLKERKVQKRKATWCDFPDDGKKSTDTNSLHSDQSPVQKKSKIKQKLISETEQSKCADDQNDTEASVKTLEKKKKKKSQIVAEVPKTDANPSGESSDNIKNKKNKKKKNREKVHDNTSDHLNSTQVEETIVSPEFDVISNKRNVNELNNKKKKKLKGQPQRRKEINDNSFQLIINGKEVELIRFDGFPIMKKDAERLTELKSNMIKKGIPKSEVQRTIKLERRRAEKALARVKRDVCYNCRKGGHVLSDCPELKSKIPSVDAADGVCFKCGSTEHRQFECKVQRDNEFRFATCFICKEAGHIARQCPDNPKGLYPNGGCCKLCGDVTHLRKDCPTVTDKKEGSNTKLQTLGTTENIEDVENKSQAVPQQVNKKPKKISF